MKINIAHISCYIHEDNYNDGEMPESFHSYSFTIHENANSKESFLEKLSMYVGREVTESELDISGNHISINDMVAFKPNQNWDEFPTASEKEKEDWKEGKMKLYSARFTFLCHNIADEFTLN